MDQYIFHDIFRHHHQKSVQGDRTAPAGTASPSSFLQPYGEFSGLKIEIPCQSLQVRKNKFSCQSFEHFTDRPIHRFRSQTRACDKNDFFIGIAPCADPGNGSPLIMNSECPTERKETLIMSFSVSSRRNTEKQTCRDRQPAGQPADHPGQYRAETDGQRRELSRAKGCRHADHAAGYAASG